MDMSNEYKWDKLKRIGSLVACVWILGSPFCTSSCGLVRTRKLLIVSIKKASDETTCDSRRHAVLCL